MMKQICSNQTTRAQARDHLAQHIPGKEPQFGINLRDHKVDKYKRTGCLKAEYQKYKINIEKPFLTHKKQFLPRFQILYREQS